MRILVLPLGAFLLDKDKPQAALESTQPLARCGILTHERSQTAIHPRLRVRMQASQSFKKFWG
jgi:hypothetical protein